MKGEVCPPILGNSVVAILRKDVLLLYDNQLDMLCERGLLIMLKQ